jgi:hypothetical protein
MAGRKNTCNLNQLAFTLRPAVDYALYDDGEFRHNKSDVFFILIQ